MMRAALLFALLVFGASDELSVLRARVEAELAAGRGGDAIRTLWEIEALCTAAGDRRSAALAVRRIGERQIADQRFASARATFEDRLQRLRDHFGEAEDPELARAMSDLAFCEQQLGRVDEALELFGRALDMQRRIAPEDPLALAIGSSNVAFCLLALGRGDEALPRFEQALESMVGIFGGEHEYVAIATSNLGTALLATGRDVAALARFEEAYELRRRLHPGDHPHVARALSNLANAHATLGAGEESLARHEKALRMRERLHAGNHPGLVASLNNVGGALAAAGRHTEALAKFRRALEMLRVLVSDDSLEAAILLNNIGATLLELGRRTEALIQLEAAESVWRRVAGGNHPGRATNLDRLGACLIELGELERALEKLEDALEMRRGQYRGDHRDIAASHAHLGDVLLLLDEGERAWVEYDAALEMRKRLFRDIHPEIAESLRQYAACLEALAAKEQLSADPNEALDLIEQALAMYREANEMNLALAGSSTPGSDPALTGSAGCVQCLGRGDETIAVVAEGLAMLSRRSGVPGFASSLGSMLVDTLGRPEEAVGLLDRAIRELERRGAAEPELYATIARAHVLAGNDAQALNHVERARVRRLMACGDLGELDAPRAAEGRARESGDRERFAEIEAACGVREESARELASIEARGGSFEELANARACHAEALERCAELAGAEAGFVRPARADELQALLGDEERLVYYALSEEQSFAFVVSAGGGVRAHALLWPDGSPLRKAQVQSEVGDYLRAMAISAALGDAPAAAGAIGGSRPNAERGHRLFQALLPESIREELYSAERAFIVPDGALSGLPFESLVIEPAARLSSSRFLVDEPRAPSFAYLPSGSFLSATRGGIAVDSALEFLRHWRGGGRVLEVGGEAPAVLVRTWPGRELEGWAAGGSPEAQLADRRRELRARDAEPWVWAGVVLVGDPRWIH